MSKMAKFKKYLILLLFISFGFGCSNEVTEDATVVAIVAENEITLKDIRSLYSVKDEEIPLMVENFVKEEVMLLEAKRLRIDVTEELEVLKKVFPFADMKHDEFLVNQADYLGITVEEYYEKYYLQWLERDLYINHLINEMLDLESDHTDELEVRINDYIDNLLQQYEDDIAILL